jgi:hypothetical protein
MKKMNHPNSPESRRTFLRTCGTLIAGGSVLGVAGVLTGRALSQEPESFWQLDPSKCTFLAFDSQLSTKPSCTGCRFDCSLRNGTK